MAGTGGHDISLYLDAISGATDQHDLGASEVRGVAVEGIGATVTVGDLMLPGGADPDAAVEEPPEPGGFVDPDAVASLLDIEVPVEVWVDGDGLIRRLVVETDVSALAGAIAGPGDPPARLDAPSSREVTDFFDYGDPLIEVTVPAESVDITDEMFTDSSVLLIPSSGDPQRS